MNDMKQNPDPSPGLVHDFGCTHDPCRCVRVSQEGPVPPTPEPMWHRSWRTMWRWRAECVEHGQRFATLDDFDRHFLAKHLGHQGDSR